MPTVATINVTPVKSTALHRPPSVRLETDAPVHDRLFFFVDGRGERYAGDAKAPMMLIHSEFDVEGDRLLLRMPDGLEVEGPAAPGDEVVSVDHAGVRVPGHIVDGPWEDALSSFVGRRTRIAKLDRPGTLVDEPVTVVSLASVAELARQGGRDALDARRFRMTLELEGCEPHQEDTWSGLRLAIGDAELLVREPVGRCVITTLDQDTGRQDFPTMKVIAGYREPLANGSPPFGRFARVLSPGTVSVGDTVEVLEAEAAG